MEETKLQNLVGLCVSAMTKTKSEIFQESDQKIKDVDGFIRSKFAEVYGTPTPKYKDFKNNTAYFEIIEQVLTVVGYDGIEENEFYRQFAEVIYIDRGDHYEFRMEDAGVVVFSEFAGDHWDINRQKLGAGHSITIDTKVYAAGMYEDFLQFMRGRLSFASMVNAVSRGLIQKIDQEVAASFASVSGQLPPEFQKTGTFTLDNLLDLHAHVEASGGYAIVLGTKKALAQITKGANVALYTEAMKNETHARGNVTQFMGMTLVELPDAHKAGTFDFAYNDDLLLVLPTGTTPRPVKILIEGDLEFTRSINDPRANYDMASEHKVITRFGTVVIVDNGLFGIYEITP